MASNTGKPNPWISFFIIIMVVAFIALCLFLPENVIRQTAELERQQMLIWGGQGATNWVGLQTAEFLKDLSLEVSRITSLDINQAFKDWLVDRLLAGLLWYDVFAYRMFSAVIWFMVICPFMMAACADAYYLREIRKSMFVSQSPLRLRIGSIFSILSFFLMIAWLIVPLPVPAIVAPVLIITLAFSSWIWMANLQKRI